MPLGFALAPRILLLVQSWPTCGRQARLCLAGLEEGRSKRFELTLTMEMPHSRNAAMAMLVNSWSHKVLGPQTGERLVTQSPGVTRSHSHSHSSQSKPPRPRVIRAHRGPDALRGLFVFIIASERSKSAAEGSQSALWG